AVDALLGRLPDLAPGAERAELERSLFQEAHRLKGAAGTLRLPRLEAVAGRLASSFAGARDGLAALDVDGLAEERRELLQAAGEQIELPDDETPRVATGLLTVLHVEDDPVTARLFQRSLGADPGVSVLPATTGREALGLARRE